MDREIRVSPDGNTIAIRSDIPDEESWNAWGCMNIPNGGHWASTSQVSDWGIVTAIAAYIPPAEPENPVTPPEPVPGE